MSPGDVPCRRHPFASVLRSLLKQPPVLAAACCMAWVPAAYADDECGEGATIVCRGSAYSNGVAYTGRNLDVTLASGAVVDTSGGTPQVGGYSVGFGISSPWLVDSGDIRVTVEQGARISVTQPQTAPLGFMGIAVRGSAGKGNSAFITNDGDIDVSGNGGRAVYAFMTGDVAISNGSTGIITSSGTGSGTYGIFAMSTEGGRVAVINHGSVSTGGKGVRITTSGVATLVNTGVITGETGASIEATAASANGVVNDGGRIQGSTGQGLVLDKGAFDVVNENHGLISGTVGVQWQASGSVLTNRATIAGTEGTAISISGNHSALVLDTGSVLHGDVLSAGTGNTLTLEGQSTNEGNLEGFSTLTMAGSTWLLSGKETTASASPAATDVQRGTLIISGSLDNEGAGAGVTIQRGATLQWGDGGTTGAVIGAITDDGTLAFRRADTITYADVLSGDGGLEQLGPGTLRLQGMQAYTGPTRVQGGVLAVEGVIRSDTSVAARGTLAGFGTVRGNVTNRGVVWPGQAVVGDADIGTLTIRGHYVGQGGLLELNTYLGTDGSPSDVLSLDGGTASGHTGVLVHALSSTPARPTIHNGILLVSAVHGAKTTPDAFSLASEVREGTFDYRLFRGGVDGTSPDSWYLRNVFDVASSSPSSPYGPAPASETLPDTPPPRVLPPGEYPIIGPEIATYSAVQPIAQQMGRLSLGTLQERWGDSAMRVSGALSTDHGPSVWARVYASSMNNQYVSYAEPSAKGDLSGLQMGADVWQGEWLPGCRERWGGYVSSTHASAKVSGLMTNRNAAAYTTASTGSLALHQTAAGVYWTHDGARGWYLDTVMQASVYNGAASTANARLPTHAEGFLGSLELGYPFSLPQWGSRFALEPQLQGIWQQVRFSDANDGLGAVSLGNGRSKSGRIGLRGRWTLRTQSGQSWQAYLAVNVWRDWSGRTKTIYGVGQSVPLIAQASRLQLAGGVTGRLNKRLAVYIGVSYQRAIGNTAYTRRKAVSGQAGLRYTW